MNRPDENTGKILLAFICTFILGYGVLYSKNTVANLTYLIGYNLPLTLIIWGVFYALIARNHGSYMIRLSFISIFICLITSSLIGYSNQKREAKLALSEIQDLVDSSIDEQGLPKRIERPINTTPKASGEFGEIERFIKEFMDQLETQRNDYLLELEAIGWDGILDANRIERDKTFIESKLLLKNAKKIINKYKNKTQLLLNNTRDKMHYLNINESLKSSLISGFDRGLENANTNIYRMWSLEAKVLSQFENVLDFLQEKKGSWVVEGQQILFNNDKDLNQYNFYIEQIQNLADEQEQIQLRSVQSVNQIFDRIDEMK